MQSIGKYVIYAIVIAAVIAVGLVVLNQMGIPVPAWVITIGWIAAVAVVGVVVIRFLMKLGGSPPP